VKNVKNHQPLNYEDSLLMKGEIELDIGDKIWVYTKISHWNNEKNLTVKHSWFRGDTIINKVVRDVYQAKMLYSYQTMSLAKTGKWKVKVRDINGNPLEEVAIKVSPVKNNKKLLLSFEGGDKCTKNFQEKLRYQEKATKNSWLNFEIAPSYYNQGDKFSFFTTKVSWLSKKYYLKNTFSISARLGILPLKYSGQEIFISYFGDIISRYDSKLASFELALGKESWKNKTNNKIGISTLFDSLIIKTKLIDEIGLDYSLILDDQKKANVFSLLLRKSF
jgi:hypothetical protein